MDCGRAPRVHRIERFWPARLQAAEGTADPRVAADDEALGASTARNKRRAPTKRVSFIETGGEVSRPGDGRGLRSRHSSVGASSLP